MEQIRSFVRRFRRSSRCDGLCCQPRDDQRLQRVTDGNCLTVTPGWSFMCQANLQLLGSAKSHAIASHNILHMHMCMIDHDIHCVLQYIYLLISLFTLFQTYKYTILYMNIYLYLHSHREREREKGLRLHIVVTTWKLLNITIPTKFQIHHQKKCCGVQIVTSTSLGIAYLPGTDRTGCANLSMRV